MSAFKLREHTTAIILFVVAVGLVVYAYKDRESVTDVERAAREGDLFPAWRRENVTSIELTHGSEILALEKHDDDGGAGTWWITTPRKEIADYAAVEGLLISLEHGHYVRKSNAAESSFDSPRARGVIRMGAVTFEFALGQPAPSPDGASYFELKGGERVVVSKDLTTDLLQPADHYRSHAVVPYLSIQLDSMEIVTPAHTWSLVRKTPIAFNLEPLGVRASRTKLDRVWGALGDTRAESFLQIADAKKLTENPRVKITLKPAQKSEAPTVLRLGGTCAGHDDDVAFYREGGDAANAPIGACVPKGVLAALEIEPDLLVDEGAFTAHADEIEEVFLESGANKVDLARMGNGFHERAPEDRNLAGKDSDGISHLVSVLAACDGARFVRGATADGPVLGRVKIHGSDNDEEIEVGKKYFRRLADNAIIVAPERLTTEMLPHASLFRAARVFAEDLGDARVDAITLDCGVFQAFEHHADRFVATVPVNFVPDDSALAGFSDAFFRLHAQAWVADSDTGAFGTTTSKCSASLTVASEGGEKKITLLLGDEGDKGIFARVPPDPNVMLLPIAAHDLIGAIYMDREVARPTGEITRIKIARAGAPTVTLSRNDEAREARDAFDQADALSFDKVVRVGAAAKEDGLDPPHVRIELDATSDGGSHSQKKISIGAKIGNVYIARVDGTAAIYGVSVNRVRALVNDPASPVPSDVHDGGAP